VGRVVEESEVAADKDLLNILHGRTRIMFQESLHNQGL